jgi:pyruvate dehydrogenase (quinone)
MQECDTLLMVGSSFPYAEFLPEEGQARAVQIDIDARMLSIRYPMEVPLVGDSAETLRALIPYLQRVRDEVRLPMLYVSHQAEEVERIADAIHRLE